MISERDIWTAQAVIKQRGDGAELHAAQRADVLLAEGDLEGQRVWKRVLAAITAIQRPTPTHREKIH